MIIFDSFKPFWPQKYQIYFLPLQKRMNGLNIGKAAVLALVASWAIYGTERVRIPVKKGLWFGASGATGYERPFFGATGYEDRGGIVNR